MILKKLGTEYKLYGEDDSCIATTQESPHKRLSKQNCDEIFGVIDIQQQINKKLNDYHVFREAVAYYNKDKYAGKKVEEAFIKGAEYIVKILLPEQSKLFTVEDIQNILDSDEDLIYLTADEQGNVKFILDEEVLINSLQQPKEIEVKIEMEKYGYCEGCRKAGMWHCAHADTCGYAETRERPKLDENDCLILKKK